MLTSAISSTISTTSACPACQRPYGPITPAFDERRSALLDWVTSPTGLILPVPQIVRELNRRGIDSLVDAAHVAGMLDPYPFLDIPLESWERTFAVNTRGPFLVGQAVARQMVRQGGGGRIVLVASNVARTPRLNNAAYAASKAAVVHLVRCMALELAKHAITVNALCPGSTATVR